MANNAEPASEQRELRSFLLLARVQGAHALRGELKVDVLTDREGGLSSVTDCFLLKDGDDQGGQPAVITGTRGAGGSIISLQGVEQREEAEKLRGYYLAVERSASYLEDEDAWYVPDLIGCEVHDETRGLLGNVREVLQGHANDNLSVQRPQTRRDLLVPVLKTVINSVDIEAGIIRVTLPEGLWEIYED